jgi:anti-sigma factor RsiW
MTACDDKLLLLNALVDGELDAGHALELEAHVATCRGCAAELDRLRTVTGALRGAGLGYAAPTGFQDRMLAALAEAEAPPPAPIPLRPRRRYVLESWIAGGAVSAIAASLALFVAVAPTMDTLPGELVDGHVRSLQAAHLVDVATSDRHTVKPWFNGKVAFAPPVTDLADQGFPLAGGRLDHIAGRDTAVLVFHRRAHVINLFIWPGQADRAPKVERRQGYTLVRWGRDGLIYWAVSDIDSPDLEAFQSLFAARTGA